MANKTDKQVFNEVFKELRKKGFVARQNYQCCQSCGWASMDSDYDVNDDSNIVFYHGQDADAFENGELIHMIYLAWQGDGDLIKKTFESYGFNVDWNGAEHKRIGILPRKTIYAVKYKSNYDNEHTTYAYDEYDLDEIKREIERKELELVEVREIPRRKVLTSK